MADALSVYPLEQAKTLLKVDFADFDALITRLIRTAVALVERHTSHRLYERDEVLSVRGGHELYYYPVSVVSLSGADGEPVDYTLENRALSAVLCFGRDTHATLTVRVGYASAEDVPAPFLTAIEELIAHLYANRGAADIPQGIQLLINPYRRHAYL
jgi:uncharacterized phiE125 gp8 family phage protein